MSSEAGTKLAAVLDKENADVELDAEMLSGSVQDIANRTRLIEGEARLLRNEVLLLSQELKSIKEKIKENQEKVKMNKQLPYLVANIVEVRALRCLVRLSHAQILDMNPNAEDEEDGATVDLDAKREQCVVVKTSTRQVIPRPCVTWADGARRSSCPWSASWRRQSCAQPTWWV